MKEFSSLIGCDLDTEAFSDIMERNIKGDLKCLEKSLVAFTELVQSSKPGFLSRLSLKRFAEKNITDLDSKTFALLDLVFDANSLLFGDSPDFGSS